MHKVTTAVLVVAALLAGGVHASSAQSLADIAKKEEKRRKELKGGKTYTNKDLGAVPAPTTPPPATSTPSTGSSGSSPAASSGSSETPAAKPQETKDQAYWSGRMKGLVTQVERDQSYATAMESRVNGALDRFRQPRRSGAALGDRDRARQGHRGARPPQERGERRAEGDRRARRRSAPRRRAAGLAALVARRAADPPILLVEDKDSLRAMLRLALEAQGHTVIEARDQPEAVQVLRSSRPGRRAVGSAAARRRRLGVLRAAKELDPELPVIVMTAFGSFRTRWRR